MLAAKLAANRRRRWHSQRRLLRVTAAAVLIWAGAHLIPKLPSLIRSRGVSPTNVLSRPTSRRVYPYSIIRGGAYSAAELTGALDVDSVAARHYAMFQRALVHTARSPFSVPVFVSYRVGDSIYWSKRPVRLPLGETLLTDGTYYARARCGNRISEMPETPIGDIEPAPPTMDEPEPPVDLQIADLDSWSENRLPVEFAPPLQELAPAQELSALTEIVLPPILVPWPPPTVPEVTPVVIPAWPTAPITPSPPVAPVPEPALMAPIALVLAGLLAARLRRKT
jgi:hypothetical protein